MVDMRLASGTIEAVQQVFQIPSHFMGKPFVPKSKSQLDAEILAYADAFHSHYGTQDSDLDPAIEEARYRRQKCEITSIWGFYENF